MHRLLHLSALVLLAVVLVAPAPAAAQDCSKCRSFPSTCIDVENCIKNCKVAPFQAFNCMKAGKIDMARCKQLYPDCEKTLKCEGCSGFPTLCSKVDTCVKECNVAAVQAQNCFQSGKIDEAKCKQIYPQCKADDPACAGCRSYPTLCGTIDKCVKDCKVAPVQAQNCRKAGKIDLAKCKAIYPQCE